MVKLTTQPPGHKVVSETAGPQLNPLPVLRDCMFLIVTNTTDRTIQHKCINFTLLSNLPLHLNHLLILNGNMLLTIFR